MTTMSENPENRRLPAVMDSRQAAEYLGVSYGRFRNLLWLGLGPKSFSYGKRDRRFRVADLDDFINRKVAANNPELSAPSVKRPRGRPRKGVALAFETMALLLVASVVLGVLLWWLGH